MCSLTLFPLPSLFGSCSKNSEPTATESQATASGEEAMDVDSAAAPGASEAVAKENDEDNEELRAALAMSMEVEDAGMYMSLVTLYAFSQFQKFTGEKAPSV